jgi:hypothetical protein
MNISLKSLKFIKRFASILIILIRIISDTPFELIF